MFRSLVLLAALACLVAPAASVAAAPAEAPPNVVLIFIDDMGYADIGPFGNTEVRTPHLDAFAKEGMKFTNFYATPVCSMSRACLMTGCYNARVSVPGVLFPNSKIGLHPDEFTLGDAARQKGYATACIGKWHLGHQKQFLPTRQGFDLYFGIPYSNDMGTSKGNPKNPPLPLIRGEETIETEPDQALLTKRYTEEAEKFIRANKDKPFFLYLPHTMIHFPLAASEDFKGKSKFGFIGDTIEEIDWSVGKIMKTLNELDLDRKTLVIFTSDNGPANRTAGPFRGRKGTVFEGGIREPCIMRRPGTIPAGTTCERMAGNIDLLPTLAKMFGATLPADRILDGRDIGSLLLDPNAPAVRDTHLHYARDGKLAAVRHGDLKLFLDGVPPEGKPAGKPGNKPGNKAAGPNAAAQQPAEKPAHRPALFDLKADPGETQDIAGDRPDDVARLKDLAIKLDAEIHANRRPAGTVE